MSGPSVLVDMNLSPDWVPFLQARGIAAEHWRDVGGAKDPDPVIMKHAALRGQIVLTHDLDFGDILAIGGASGPSVVLIRTQGTLVEDIGEQVVRLILAHADELRAGALAVFDIPRSRVRLLPLRR
jgi:predicted nuclease of predicted toxin-antitoxin system